MKKYIGPILSITSLAILFATLFILKEQNKQIPILKHRLDSLTQVNQTLKKTSLSK